MPPVLYSTTPVEDEVGISVQIESFCGQIGMTNIRVNSNAIRDIVSGMKIDFPHEAGLERASAFKKVANFLCFFIALKPIRSPIPSSAGKISEYDVNVVVGLDIAINSLHEALIHSRGNIAFNVIKHPLALSDHSYYDMLEMLEKITPNQHFHMLAILLEQIAYKTNPDCQYEDLVYGQV